MRGVVEGRSIKEAAIITNNMALYLLAFNFLQFLLTGLYMSIFHSSIIGKLLKYQEISPLVIS